MKKTIGTTRNERRAKMPAGSSLQTKSRLGRTTTTRTPVHVRGVNMQVGASLSDYVRTRLGFKLGKFATGIERVSVRFENESGVKGAPLRTCRIKVALPATASVLIETRDADARAAFDEGADAVERAVRRAFDRRRSRRLRTT